MNTRTRGALAGTAVVVALLAALATPSGLFAQNPPAAADNQISGAPPSSAYVWMSGHWTSEGGQWTWVAAHWELPPARSAVWVAGHWAPDAGKWVWVNGAWNISEAPQSQASPPQPPAPGATPAGVPMPMPSTPAPMVEGGYGPGGIPRVIDQGAVTTDYGPMDYGAEEPGYYWAGDPYWGGDAMLWGYPGAYFGLGWGPAFYYGGNYGWRGHGGYPRGGRGGYPSRTGYPGHAGYSGHAGGRTGTVQGGSHGGNHTR